MSEPRLLFGMGATKAGTSWLHRWLEVHPDVHLRTIKELHWFDGMPAARIEALRRERAELAARGARPRRLRDFDDLIGAFRSGDLTAYRRYLETDRGQARIVGDITPAYGLLPVARLKPMVALGESLFVYILRDPVARLWSHVRMIAGRRHGRVTQAGAGEILDRTLRGAEPEIAERSDYSSALTRLFSVAPESRRLVVFFEELFDGRATDAICDFLGVARQMPLNAVVHGGTAVPMRAEQAEAARIWLAPQYDDVARRFGRMPPEWARDVREVIQ